MELEKILEIEINNKKNRGIVELFKNKNYFIRIITRDMWYFAPFYTDKTDIEKLKEEIAKYAQNLI